MLVPMLLAAVLLAGLAVAPAAQAGAIVLMDRVTDNHALADELDDVLARFQAGATVPKIATGQVSDAQGTRRALVIGIDEYDHLTPLAKARNDALAVAEALKSLDFRVTLKIELDVRAFDDALETFYASLEPGDVAFFFFAGHGVADGATNYLLPADMPRLDSTENPRLARNAVDAARVVSEIKARGVELAFVVLDACRDSPFAHETVRGGTPTQRGLARIEPQQGAFVIYSAGIGQTALDRLQIGDPDPNSVFTRMFRPILETPGLPLVEIAKRTQVEVRALAETVRHPQAPAYYDQVIGQFYFQPPAPRLYGLTIGIDDYRESHLRLNGAVADARNLRDALLAVGAVEVTTITNQDARRQFIEFAWAQLVARASPGDTLVLTFAGQAAAPRITGFDDAPQSILLLADAVTTGEFSRLYLSKAELSADGWAALLDQVITAADMTSWMEMAAARNLNVVVLVDGCHAGGMLLREFSNVTFIAATGVDGTASESEIDGVVQGVASAAFAEALLGAADTNMDGFATRTEIYAYVEARVAELTSTVAGRRGQVPEFQPAIDAPDLVALPLFQVPQDAASRARSDNRRAELVDGLGASIARQRARPLPLPPSRTLSR